MFEERDGFATEDSSGDSLKMVVQTDKFGNQQIFLMTAKQVEMMYGVKADKMQTESSLRDSDDKEDDSCAFGTGSRGTGSYGTGSCKSQYSDS